MGANLFTALFCLFLCSTLCGNVVANNDNRAPSPAEKTVGLFQKGQMSNVMGPNGMEKEGTGAITVTDLYSSSLVSANNMTIAIAGVKRAKYSNNIEILTKYIENEELLANNDKSTEKYWKTQFAVLNGVNGKNYVNDANGFLAVAKGDEVYLLFATYNAELLLSDSSSIPNLEFKLVVGTVNNRSSEKNPIVWKDEHSSIVFKGSDVFESKFKGTLSYKFGFAGNAFLTHDEEIMFALVVTTNMGKDMTALIHLNNKDKTQAMFEYKRTEDCYSYFFSWNKKIIMFPVSCTKSEKKIMESSDLGENWTESKEALFRNYAFLQDKHNFASVKISGKEILLFTEFRVNSNKFSMRDIYVWMTDGTRVGYVGTVVNDIENTNYGSVLQTNSSLSALLYKYKTESEQAREIEKIYFTREKEHLNNITFLLNAWKKNDEIVSAPCEITNKENIVCTTPLPTDGLVGFLRDTTNGESNTEWKDEYYYSNATVENGDKVTNGFSFNREKAGAKWSVSKKQNDQPYNFKDSGFTLVATVTVGNGTNNKHNSILGVGLRENNNYYNYNYVGLWCNTDGEWAVTDKTNDFSKQNGKKCEREHTYSVALILNNDTKLSIYVNGKKLTGLEEKKITPTEIIDHFYFGVANDVRVHRSTTTAAATSDVTITNVLLYNRPFNEGEIERLQPKINNNEKENAEQTLENKDITQQNHKESTTETNISSGTPAAAGNEKQNKGEKNVESVTPSTKEGEVQKQVQQLPPIVGDSAARVGFTEFSLLFGVLTLLGRYVCV